MEACPEDRKEENRARRWSRLYKFTDGWAVLPPAHGPTARRLPPDCPGDAGHGRDLSVVEQLAGVAQGAESKLVRWFGGQKVGGWIPHRLAQGRPVSVFGLGDDFTGEEAVEDA